MVIAVRSLHFDWSTAKNLSILCVRYDTYKDSRDDDPTTSREERKLPGTRHIEEPSSQRGSEKISDSLA